MHNNRPGHKELPKEEYAIVLDVVQEGGNSFKSGEVAQAIGTTNYTLLELVPKQGVVLKAGDKVYIGDGKREEIQYIKRSLFAEKLTGSAKSELEFALEELIVEKAEFFVNFFNVAGPITIRKHALELVPGIGKKHLQDLLEARDEKKFESFEDIKTRCTFLSDPIKALVERITLEINGEDEINMFVRK